MKRLFFAVLLFAGCVIPCFAQGEFSPDRPGVSTGPGVLHKGGVLWETGIESSKEDGWMTVLPTTMFRFGISEFAEFRLEYDGVLSRAGDKFSYVVAPLIIGAKLHMVKGHGAVPDISLMANLDIPCTRALCEEMKLAPSLYLLFENPVNDWFSIGYNIGSEWDGASAAPDAFLALCLNFSPGDKVGLFAESYNYLGASAGKFCGSYNVDAGISYTVAENVQLDLYGGLNLNTPGSMYMLGCGIAWMIK